ncbi:MAG: hypothetical protein ABFS56_01070 [Pseudomonadota bacterium]
MGDKEKIYESRDPGQMFDLYEPTSELTELYIDGVGQIMLGTTISKVSFYSVSGFKSEDDKQIEQRDVKHRIILPTKALLDFCLNTLMKLKGSAHQLEAGLDNDKNQIYHILGQLIVTGDKEH